MHSHDGQVTEVGRLLRRDGIRALLQTVPKKERTLGKLGNPFRPKVPGRQEAHLLVCLELVPDFPKVPREHVFRNRVSVDSDPFTNGDHVRRRVEADFGVRSEGRQQGRDKGAGRAFALGAGDV